MISTYPKDPDVTCFWTMKLLTLAFVHFYGGMRSLAISVIRMAYHCPISRSRLDHEDECGGFAETYSA